MNYSQEKPTQTLSEFATHARYEDIPEDIIESTKLLVLDSIANMVGGASLEPGRIVIELFESMGGIPECTVIATGNKLPLLHAIYVNSYLTNVLDFDDTYDNLAHPGATVIPPAISVGEKMKVNGKKLLNAIVVGYETSLRIGLAIKASPERYKLAWGLSTWQIFGATIASGCLMGLTSEQLRNAMGLAGFNAPVPYARKLGLELNERPFTWAKNNYGWASMGGVLGSMLAQKGFLGNKYILDGERGFWVMAGSDRCDFERMLDGLGEFYMTPNTSFKPYAACRWSHTTLDGCHKILEEHPIRPNEIRAIKIRGFYDLVHSMAEKSPKNIIDAQFSIPYLVSLSLSGHSPAKGLSEIHLQDPTVLNLAKKVDLEIDPDSNKYYFEKGGTMLSTIIIETTNDERFEASVSRPKGSPEVPMTRDEVIQKFNDVTTPIIGPIKAEKMLEHVMHLESVEDVSDIVNN